MRSPILSQYFTTKNFIFKMEIGEDFVRPWKFGFVWKFGLDFRDKAILEIDESGSPATGYRILVENRENNKAKFSPDCGDLEGWKLSGAAESVFWTTNDQAMTCPARYLQNHGCEIIGRSVDNTWPTSIRVLLSDPFSASRFSFPLPLSIQDRL